MTDASRRLASLLAVVVFLGMTMGTKRAPAWMVDAHTDYAIVVLTQDQPEQEVEFEVFISRESWDDRAVYADASFEGELLAVRPDLGMRKVRVEVHDDRGRLRGEQMVQVHRSRDSPWFNLGLDRCEGRDCHRTFRVRFVLDDGPGEVVGNVWGGVVVNSVSGRPRSPPHGAEVAIQIVSDVDTFDRADRFGAD